ncbi:MAG: fimbrillin family protein [Prevotella sp.]|nr:fimbrillin family protein [Prevotella sp.]
MNKRQYQMTALAAALLLCGCASDEAGRDVKVPIGLSVGVEQITRAGISIQETQFESGQSIYAFFDGEKTTISHAVYETSDDNGSTTTATTPYFKQGESSATVYAYYPSSKMDETKTSFTVENDQTGDANYKKSDLMYATGSVDKDGVTATASLTFNHMLSKVIVTVNAVNGVSKIKKVRIVGGSRTIDMTAKACALGTTLSDAIDATDEGCVKMYEDETGAASISCAAILPPQSLSGSNDFIKIETDLGWATYQIAKTMVSGNAYSLTLNVSAAAVGTTTTITAWNSVNSLTVNTGSDGAVQIGDIADYTYDGNPKTPTPTVSYSGTTLTKDTDYELHYIKNINAGTATVLAICKGSYDGYGARSFTIRKADATVTTAPEANSLTYTGSAQALVTAGAAANGELQYSLAEDGDYTTTIPTGTNAGDYTVWYRVVGNANYNDVAPQSIGVTIGKAAGSISYATTALTKYVTDTGTSLTNPLTATTGTGIGTVTYSISGDDVCTLNATTGAITLNGNIGVATITATVTDGDNYQYATSTASYTLTVLDLPLIDYASLQIGDVVNDDGTITPYASAPDYTKTPIGIVVYLAQSTNDPVCEYKHALVMSVLSAGCHTWGPLSTTEDSEYFPHVNSRDEALAETHTGKEKTVFALTDGHSHPAFEAAANYTADCSMIRECTGWFLPSISQIAYAAANIYSKYYNTANSVTSTTWNVWQYNNKYMHAAFNGLLSKAGTGKYTTFPSTTGESVNHTIVSSTLGCVDGYTANGHTYNDCCCWLHFDGRSNLGIDFQTNSGGTKASTTLEVFPFLAF